MHAVSDSTRTSRLFSVSLRVPSKDIHGSDVKVQVENVVARSLESKVSIKLQVARAIAVELTGHDAV
jgi:hypothetical protein